MSDMGTKKIEQLQDKALRIINFFPKGTPINDTD